MTIANWCVLIAAFLPVLFAGLAKGSMATKRRSEGGYDNNDPRGWFDKQAGWRTRMNSVQQNSFEALPFFIGAVALAWFVVRLWIAPKPEAVEYAEAGKSVL